MPRHFPLHDGPLRLPQGSDLGSIALTFRGPASLTITDNVTGHSVFSGGTPDAAHSDVSTVQVDLSAWEDTPADLTVAVTGNVQGQLTTN